MASKGDISNGVCPLLLTPFCGCLSYHPTELLVALLAFPSLPCSERGFQRQAWWCTALILALGRWQEKDQEFQGPTEPCETLSQNTSREFPSSESGAGTKSVLGPNVSRWPLSRHHSLSSFSRSLNFHMKSHVVLWLY